MIGLLQRLEKSEFATRICRERAVWAEGQSPCKGPEVENPGAEAAGGWSGVRKGGSSG